MFLFKIICTLLTYSQTRVAKILSFIKKLLTHTFDNSKCNFKFISNFKRKNLYYFYWPQGPCSFCVHFRHGICHKWRRQDIKPLPWLCWFVLSSLQSHPQAYPLISQSTGTGKLTNLTENNVPTFLIVQNSVILLCLKGNSSAVEIPQK